MQCFDPQLLEYPPSVIAASAYWLTRISLKKFDWVRRTLFLNFYAIVRLISKQPEGLVHCTGYGTDKLLPAVTSMVRYLCSPPRFEIFFQMFASTSRMMASEFFYDWARSHWEEGSRLNAGLEAELPFLKEATDDSWRESYPFEEWIEEEEQIGSEATCDPIPAQAAAHQAAPNSE